MAEPHPCKSCCELFPNKTSLCHHHFNWHTIPSPFTKDGKVYKVVHKNGRLECLFDLCSKTYINWDDFQTHLRKVHSTEFKVSEDTPGPSTDEISQSGTDSMFCHLNLLISQRHWFLALTALELRAPPSHAREGVKVTEHIEAICGQGASGMLHVGRDVARLEGALEVSLCSVNNTHIIGDG